mmetsp:Transcript_5016/g.5913  ORF Transcript_5016/g.5913 Transcript_5016/m.5913 type:complete len:130 (-) Transcript_5016:63-452(-)
MKADKATKLRNRKRSLFKGEFRNESSICRKYLEKIFGKKVDPMMVTLFGCFANKNYITKEDFHEALKDEIYDILYNFNCSRLIELVKINAFIESMLYYLSLPEARRKIISKHPYAASREAVSFYVEEVR